MKKNGQTEKMQQMIEEIGPQAVNSMRDLLADPMTPVSSRVQLIGMVLDRILGKAETPLRVTAGAESTEEAEAKLAEMISEMTGEKPRLKPEGANGGPGGFSSPGSVQDEEEKGKHGQE